LVRYDLNEFGYELQLHAAPFTILFAVWILAFYIMNLYDERSLRNNLPFYSDLLRAGVFASTVSIAFFYLIPYFKITPRANLFLFTIVFGILETASRSLFNDL